MHLARTTSHDLLDVQDRLRGYLLATSSLEEAAAACVRAIHGEFAESIVLARLFVSLPFTTLPEDLKRKAWDVVEAQALHPFVHDHTPVLTLLGTYGRDPAWCDRRTSAHHAAIPLCSQSFVDTIPMIARMLQDMGVDLGIGPDPKYARKILGSGWTGLFYVEDARIARDDHGRRIIPAAEFVERHNVRTVFGLGKAYASGSIATLIVFTNTLVPRAKIEELAALITLFKAATINHIQDGAIFTPPSAGGRAADSG
jgi:hypothetical protein